MKQITLRFKQGEVTIAQVINNEVVIRTTEQSEVICPFGDKESNEPNTLVVVNSLLRSFIEELKTNNRARMTIALPRSIFQIMTDLDLLTQTVWLNQMIYTTVKIDNDFVIRRRKAADRRALKAPETALFRQLLNNLRLCLGCVAFCDSKFTPIEHKQGETEERATWCRINETLRSIRQNSAAPTFLTADDTNLAFTPDYLSDDEIY